MILSDPSRFQHHSILKRQIIKKNGTELYLP